MDIKILIIDDKKEYLQTAMKYIIEDAIPYGLLCAPDGMKGVEIAKKELPDIIIMDWEMPGMDGIEATKCLKASKSTQDIPIIIATGIRISSKDLKKAFEAGASDFIRKPLEKIEFLARINSHLKQVEYLRKIKNQSEIIDKTESKRLKEIISTLKSSNDENREIINFYENMLSVFSTKINNLIGQDGQKTKELQPILSAIDLARTKSKFILNGRNVPDGNYVKSLLKVHSNLTPQEIQLCFFIKNDFQSKEIAELTFRETGSIKVLRSRLRKKLQLTDSQNLYAYLNSI
jgi:DNA-binding response OmpR family regulator/DNA-binding CsgD family transcriptional regulator